MTRSHGSPTLSQANVPNLTGAPGLDKAKQAIATQRPLMRGAFSRVAVRVQGQAVITCATEAVSFLP
jgi:hypothetical protein